MLHNELNEWGQRLDSGEQSEPLLVIAARLRADASAALRPSSRFRSELRARLLEQSQQTTRPQRRFTVSATLAGLLALTALAGAWMLTNIGPTPSAPLTASTQPTVTPETSPSPSQPVDLPSPTPALVELRLVFNHSPQALFGSNANNSGGWRGYQNVFIANLDGSEVTALMDGPNDINQLEAISPDGQRALIFSRPQFVPQNGEHSLLGDLYVMNIDGSGVTKLASGYRSYKSTSAGYGAAYWLADGQRLALVASDDDGPGIFLVNADGTGRVRLPAPEVDPTHPWEATPLWLLPSANPDWIYWQAGVLDGNTDKTGGYWQTALDGSITQPVWEDLGIGHVALDPTGSYMAYTPANCWAELEPACNLLSVADVNNDKPILQYWGGTPQNFYWSPDGSYLLVDVFVKGERGYGQVYWTWSPSTLSATQLPEGIQLWSQEGWSVGVPPQWSPDGRQILFENFAWELPKILDLNTMNVREGLTTLRPRPGIVGPWGAAWLPPSK